MFERAEVYIIDDEGIFLRAFTEEQVFFYDGDPEEIESPLMQALGEYYENHAAQTLLCRGFSTPLGDLFWESELVTPFGDDTDVEVGERLFLMSSDGDRMFDEYTYRMLTNGKIPTGWMKISR